MSSPGNLDRLELDQHGPVLLAGLIGLLRKPPSKEGATGRTDGRPGQLGVRRHLRLVLDLPVEVDPVSSHAGIPPCQDTEARGSDPRWSSERVGNKKG